MTPSLAYPSTLSIWRRAGASLALAAALAFALQPSLLLAQAMEGDIQTPPKVQAKPPKAKPIDQVAFVFLAEADARSHLEALWLRELECWVADDRSKRRLDDTFTVSSSSHG